MESKKSIQRKAKASLSEKATPEKAQEESSTPSVRIMKNGIRAVNTTKTGQTTIIIGLPRPHSPPAADR
jgi:hypothetical protein